MSIDFYKVNVEQWAEGATGDMSARAGLHGLDVRGVEAIIARMGGGDRAVEVDIYIEEYDPRVELYHIDHSLLVMVLYDAGLRVGALAGMRRLLEARLGGADQAEARALEVEPPDACFAFSVLERGQRAGDGFDIPVRRWAKVRLWMARELGGELRGERWYSGAVVPERRRMWLNHMPVADLPTLGERRALGVDLTWIGGLAMAGGRVFAVADESTAVACLDVEEGCVRWRSAPLGAIDEVYESTMSVSADGQRVYATGSNVAGRLDVVGEACGEAWSGVWPGASDVALCEDSHGRLMEVTGLDEEPPAGEPVGGVIWERDRATGARTRVIWRGVAMTSGHTLARSAPVMAVVLRTSETARVLIVERGQAVRELDGPREAHTIALSDAGDVLYVVSKPSEQRWEVSAWDVASGAQRWSSAPAQYSYVGGLCALPGGSALALADSDMLVLFGIERRCQVYAERVYGLGRGLGVSVEGDHLLVAPKVSGEVSVWKLRGAGA